MLRKTIFFTCSKQARVWNYLLGNACNINWYPIKLIQKCIY